MSNGDTDRDFDIGEGPPIRGLGSFHKSLPHNEFGEVCPKAFGEFVAATRGNGTGFAGVEEGPRRQPDTKTARLTNPQAGLASDRLIDDPDLYVMPPAPTVKSEATAAEMTELYWMALLRDVSFDGFDADEGVTEAVKELNKVYKRASELNDADRILPGIDLPGGTGPFNGFTPQSLFRLGLPGEDVGPMVSQFFIRPVHFGTQTIDQMQRPYKAKQNYLTTFKDWLKAQDSGRDEHGQDYSGSNENSKDNFEDEKRYISTMRDLARFVNKDALHQAYFNAALLMLSGKLDWTQGNPYREGQDPKPREGGFGVLGGPHILALVSEVATRALKVVWDQKWQVHLRLRPEAYGGLVHVQNFGVDQNGTSTKRAYGLPIDVTASEAAKRVRAAHKSYLLPMAFTAGSPTHPAYGAGHATVAGACVTILKAYFRTLDDDFEPVPFCVLKERQEPFGRPEPIVAYITCRKDDTWDRMVLDKQVANKLTIEGELNKLAQNVAMGRSMGGVHWRTDNARSLVLGEALAAEILADITKDVNEQVGFVFRTFARKANGKPYIVRIAGGVILVDGKAPTRKGSLIPEADTSSTPVVA
ncbi:MAG: vanadium-dependent haloperoxidase [Methylorubrum rhodinum]|uniref:vanadium-dependent haloperoxidase n=1 Tax=Methylorubrum rhodinum TaxID=29428 RepID=UPI003BAF476E